MTASVIAADAPLVEPLLRIGTTNFAVAGGRVIGRHGWEPLSWANCPAKAAAAIPAVLAPLGPGDAHRSEEFLGGGEPGQQAGESGAAEPPHDGLQQQAPG